MSFFFVVLPGMILIRQWFAGENGQAYCRITGLKALERLHRNKHTLRHQPLRQLAAAAGNGNVLAQLRDCALALGRQAAGSSGSA